MIVVFAGYGVLAAIQASSSVKLDEQGQIVGAGLSLRPTRHRLWIEGRVLYAWCALDALMYPPLLGVTARVETQCATSATALHMQVSNNGVQDVTPTEVVVSVVTPERKCGIRQEFCHHVHFFRSASDAQPWLELRPGALLLSVTEAYLLGRELTGVTECA